MFIRNFSSVTALLLFSLLPKRSFPGLHELRKLSRALKSVLSHLHSPESDTEPPTPILPVACFVGAITWNVERKVNEAMQGVEIPPGTPSKIVCS